MKVEQTDLWQSHIEEGMIFAFAYSPGAII